MDDTGSLNITQKTTVLKRLPWVSPPAAPTPALCFRRKPHTLPSSREAGDPRAGCWPCRGPSMPGPTLVSAGASWPPTRDPCFRLALSHLPGGSLSGRFTPVTGPQGSAPAAPSWRVLGSGWRARPRRAGRRLSSPAVFPESRSSDPGLERRSREAAPEPVLLPTHHMHRGAGGTLVTRHARD